jgi:hypothetical protein
VTAGSAGPDAPRRFDRDALLANLEAVRVGIAEACGTVGRDPHEVRLVAAAKTVPPEPIRWLVAAGAVDIGENYVQELAVAHDVVAGARWHFIGTLQSGTAHRVADLADVVQTLASERAASRLARRAHQRGRTLEALLEVDFTGERTGLDPEEVGHAADRAASLVGLRLTGLMTLPAFDPDPEAARPTFRRLRELAESLRGRHPGLRELSMGMSADYRVAVEEGATMVRIGTTLFGQRPLRH